MAICLNCGKNINVVGRNCPYCNRPISENSIISKEQIKKLHNDYDHRSNTLLLLSLFIPIFGFVFYVYKKEEEKLKASSAIFGALIGTIFYLAIISFFIFIKLFK